jgi:Pyruvate/2-oxoacid:ferredoxin oxidoreductase delta subunit
MDTPALAMAYDAYAASGAWFRGTGRPTTQIGRTMVNEEALDPELTVEVLDYEKASFVLRDAKRLSVTTCVCRHGAEHLGRACDAPQEICLGVNRGADSAIRHGYGREIDSAEALDLLALGREKGLVQIADNVKHRPMYLCNCCGCCCMQLRTINRHGVQDAVHTSNFIAEPTPELCRGCGRCARRCPVAAIRMVPVLRDGKQVGAMRAEVDREICLGCGVCHSACRHRSMRMAPRPQRVLTPDTTLERVVRMALDRGKLQHLLFDEGDGLPATIANRVLGVILDLPPARRALAREQVKSRFVQAVMDRFRA